MNTKTINVQVLALLGDAVLSLYIREELLKQNEKEAKDIALATAKVIIIMEQAAGTTFMLKMIKLAKIIVSMLAIL